MPAPFESGRSIFDKIIELNHINETELISLIRLPENELARPNLGSTYSFWIDFHRFSSLLGIDARRLREGFLDQLGFKPNSRGDSRAPIRTRFCPECARYGYHCVFFNLAIVAECPWHRRPLVSSTNICVLCSPYVRESASAASDYVCPECGGAEEIPIMRQCIDRFQADQEATIRGYGLELVEWRRRVQNASIGYESLLNPLDRTGESDVQFLKDVSGPLGHAVKVADMELFWKFNAAPTVVQHFRLTTTKSEDFNPTPIRLSDELGRQYRSVRHQIYKRYIKSHRKCLAAMYKLSRDECLCLNGEAICSTALAYLVWRMAVEGVGNLEAMRTARRPDYFLRMMGPGGESDPDLTVRWNYLLFFGIWNELHSQCGKFKLQVTFGNRSRWGESYIMKVMTEQHSGERWYDVFCPIPLVGNTCEGKPKLFLNEYSLWNVCGSSWACYLEESTQNAMFRIQVNSGAIRSGPHWHICV